MAAQRVSSPERLTGSPGAARAEVIFDTLADMVRSGLGGPEGCETRSSARVDEQCTQWSGTRDLSEAAELATNGWADGVDRIVSLAERISEQVSRRVEAHGMELWEEGGEVDVAAYLDGERACMWTWAEQPNKRPIVRATINISAPHTVSPEQYTFAGAIAAALVDGLESAGRRVELQVHQPVVSRNGGEPFVVGADIKGADQPVDLGAIAYAVAHPSMLRRTTFSVEELTPKAYRKHYGFSVGNGYGLSADTPEDLCGDVHLDLRQTYNLTYEEGFDWILERLREQGVEVTYLE
jgi:hypothetical protein